MLSTIQPSPSRPNISQVALTWTYGLFTAIASMVYYGVANCEFSFIQTMAGMLQCLAMVLLAMQVRGIGSDIEGLSYDSLVLHAASFACRLSSTTWLNGYLPVDASGDWLYQAVDVLSLVLAVRLLSNLRARGASCDRDRAIPGFASPSGVFCVAFCVAGLLHANMDKRPLFDTFWMTSVFLASAAMVLQLLALRALPSGSNPLAGHALSAMAMAQLLSAIYMWQARNDMTCTMWIEGFHHSSYAVLIAHLLPLLLTCDFSQDLSGLMLHDEPL